MKPSRRTAPTKRHQLLSGEVVGPEISGLAWETEPAIHLRTTTSGASTSEAVPQPDAGRGSLCVSLESRRPTANFS